MTSSTAPASAEDTRRARRAVVAASLGNALEWYDITLFAFLASTIAKVFYPGGTLAGQLMTWATFGITFVVRPLGAVLIGNYADRHGRKAALSLTIGLMTLGVFIIVVLPGFATLGIWAAVILAIARIIQGISAGGEFGSATAFLTENAERGKAYYASWQVATQGAALVLSAGITLLLTSVLDADAMTSWGWRLAFAVGLLIGPVGMYVRTKMSDTPEFEAMEQDDTQQPVTTLFKNHLGRLLAAVAIIALATFSVYLLTYLVSYSKNLKLPVWAPLLGATIAGLINLVGAPLVGRLADRVGTTRIMLGAAVAGALVGWPAFYLLQHQASVGAMIGYAVFVGVFMTFYFAPLPALLSDLFPVQVRGSGMTIAYSVGVALLGGFAPLIMTALVDGTNLPAVPGVYYVVCSVLSVIGVSFARWRFAQR